MITRVSASLFAAYNTPEAHGAKGDGVTDDTTAINAAATAAGAWGSVFLDPTKTYLVTASITPLSGQRWFGGGKLLTANGFNFNVFSLSGKTDVTIEGLRAESGTLGASYSSATARFVSAVSSSHRCKVLRCHVTGFQSAVQFNASTDCKALDNTIVTPYGWGINVQTDADYAEVRGNRISGAVNEHGIYVAGSNGNNVAGVTVAGNWVSGSAIDGIKVSYADDTNVVGNYAFSNGGEGVYVTVGANRTEVRGNQSFSNTGNGILVYSGTASDTMTRNRVIGNVVRLNTRNGISVQCASTAVVSNTWVQDNDVDDNDSGNTTTYYGIVLSGGANLTGAVVQFNRVSNETIGVRVASSVPSAVIGRNIYVSCGTGLSDSGTTTAVEWEPTGGAVPTAFTSRALGSTDNGLNLVCATSQTATVNSGLPPGFGCTFEGAVSFTAGAGVTITDLRLSGATDIFCGLVQVATDTYKVRGGKA